MLFIKVLYMSSVQQKDKTTPFLRFKDVGSEPNCSVTYYLCDLESVTESLCVAVSYKSGHLTITTI